MDDPSPPLLHFFLNDIELIGGGILALKGGRISMDQNQLTNSGSEIRIYDTLTEVYNPFGGRTEIWNRKGKILFISDGGSESIKLDVNLRNDDEMEMAGNLSLIIRDFGEIRNTGRFKVEGALSDVTPEKLLIDYVPGGLRRPSFVNTGHFIVDTESNAQLEEKNRMTIITPKFAASEDRINGRVEIKNKTWLHIASPHNETVSVVVIPEPHQILARIIGGDWVVGPDCKLSFGDREFDGVGEFARVMLEGDPADMDVKDGEIVGMPVEGHDFINDGRMILKGAVFTIQNQKFINNGFLHFIPGTLVMIENFGKSAIFRNEGSVFGSPTFEGGTVKNNGVIAPGESPGTMTVNGGFAQEADGELSMELGGTIPGDDYDQLIVNGTATLGGCLRLIFRNEAFPENGTSFSPITATTVVGVFDEIIYDMESGRQVFDVVIAETGVTASAMTLDVSTFAAWQAGVFSAEEQADENISGLTADPDEDGLANLLEYALDGNPKVVTQPRLLSHFSVDEDGTPQTVEILFSWANGMTDVQYALEFSTDLQTWDPLSSELVESNDQGLFSVILLSADLPPEIDGRAFVRLLVSEL